MGGCPGACTRVGAERQTWRQQSHASGGAPDHNPKPDHNRINATRIPAYVRRCRSEPDWVGGSVAVPGCGERSSLRRTRQTRRPRWDKVASAMQVTQILAKSAPRRYAGRITNPRWLRLGDLNYCYGVSPSETPTLQRDLSLITESNRTHTESNIFKFVMT
jgi:hypothetical protein